MVLLPFSPLYRFSPIGSVFGWMVPLFSERFTDVSDASALLVVSSEA